MDQELVYGLFKKDCYDRGEFFSNENECLQVSILKLIGYSIITASFFFKLPQLKKILSSKSVEGLSRTAAYSELIAYLNTMTLARHVGLPLSVYGETIILSV